MMLVLMLVWPTSALTQPCLLHSLVFGQVNSTLHTAQCQPLQRQTIYNEPLKGLPRSKI